jgi:hypothetical protein
LQLELQKARIHETFLREGYIDNEGQMMASPSFFDLVVELQEIHKAKDNSLE